MEQVTVMSITKERDTRLLLDRCDEIKRKFDRLAARNRFKSDRDQERDYRILWQEILLLDIFSVEEFAGYVNVIIEDLSDWCGSESSNDFIQLPLGCTCRNFVALGLNLAKRRLLARL